MPYIAEDRRDKISAIFARIQIDEPENAGELNYAITVLCQTYFALNGGRYQQINDIIGALEGAKLEFYRRVAAPYEDVKIKENGDVLNV